MLARALSHCASACFFAECLIGASSQCAYGCFMFVVLVSVKLH